MMGSGLRVAAHRARRVLRRAVRTRLLAHELLRWCRRNDVRSVFQIGTGTGQLLLALQRGGIAVNGTDLPPEEDAGHRPVATWLRKDFFDLTPGDVGQVDLMFSDCVFETLVPWRPGGGATVSKYRDGAGLDWLPKIREKVAELSPVVRLFLFIEPNFLGLQQALPHQERLWLRWGCVRQVSPQTRAVNVGYAWNPSEALR